MGSGQRDETGSGSGLNTNKYINKFRTIKSIPHTEKVFKERHQLKVKE